MSEPELSYQALPVEPFPTECLSRLRLTRLIAEVAQRPETFSPDEMVQLLIRAGEFLYADQAHLRKISAALQMAERAIQAFEQAAGLSSE